ncbi:MAG: hypothetical protein JO325_02550, partial [Solirubrobacterales bacterium]|nr:hypothetical protein [Solirubrobacterales bacterium]
QLDHGVPRAQVYSVTMYVLAGLLALGFVCNLLIRPVNEKNFMTASDLAATDAPPGAISTPARAAPAHGGTGASSPALWVAAAWLAVGIPIAWGLWVTVQKAVTLFGS